MANLITEKQRNNNRLDYIIRLTSVFLFIISILGLFLLAYVVPYWIAINSKALSMADQFKSIISIENKENVGENVTQVMQQTFDQFKAVELYSKDSFSASVYIGKIIGYINPNIRITRISYTPYKKNQVQFLVSGHSKNRDGLVFFIDDLRTKANFSSVESPISDFAKDSEISFTLNIKTTI